MSGMDRLSDSALEAARDWYEDDRRVLRMIDELLAHRRASQIAIAEEWEACTCGPCPLHPAAPAPSDGLREAVDAAWNDAIEALASKLSEMLRATAKANEKNHPQYAAEMEEWADDVQDEARALRRAAPTEGEA